MPTYEYRCKKGHDFEVMQRMADDPVVECEVCGAPVQRVFSPIAVHFKGTGFYNTDYGTKSRARELKETAEAKKKAEKSSSDSSSSGSSSSDSSGSSGAKKSDPAPAKAKAESKASAAD
ncbi:MAG TPA: zinc ribbon domain-containing protein [Solirubrobacteraceae bacterium]|nr:zinc ribbon domain-containing protein [Solirubrobacteraceae bacterium]